MNGDNLPAPRDVIALYVRCGIPAIRIFEPNHDVLEALRGSNLAVALGTRNEDITKMATDQQFANDWANTNILPYKNNVWFRWITVGNEVVPSEYAPYIARAMDNLDRAICASCLGVKITTVVAMNALSTSYPPSASAFSEAAIGPMKDISAYLIRTNSPLMLNVYPYFAYASDTNSISLEYAAGFKSDGPPNVIDGDFTYHNIFDAMVDAVHVALEKIGARNIPISISESGWPTDGNDPSITNMNNAFAYNSNHYYHVLNHGTPRRPSEIMDLFAFAMFDENQKAAGVEPNFGLFYPNMIPKYPLLAKCQH